MDSEDGQLFIKRLAHYVRTHEKALANALQLQRKQMARRNSDTPSSPSVSGASPGSFGLPSLSFSQGHLKPEKLMLTPHHLYYLLSRFEELNIPVGPMGVRLESMHAETTGSYVSFLRDSSTRIGRRNRSSDSLSIHSVSSVRSVMSGVSNLWSTLGFGGSITARNERAKAALEADLKYLYSAFTKVPCLKLAPDRRAKLISGYEEFPFDTAVPLLAFKNVSVLEICDIDIRQFFGWDRMAEQLRSLTVKRGGIDDPIDLVVSIVLDDMDRRRRRAAKTQSSPIISYATPTPTSSEVNSSHSAPPSPSHSPSRLVQSQSVPLAHHHGMSRSVSQRSSSKQRPRSSSPSKSSSPPKRPGSHRMRRSGSGSSHSSSASTVTAPNPANLPLSKWRFLRHLSLADNALTTISTTALIPLSSSLTSLDLSANLFAAIPESLAILSNLRALNLSGSMIDSLHSLLRSPLPAITALNLRGNRLTSLAGIERLVSLERLDLRDNKLTDPTELARLTSLPNLTAVWVSGNPFTKTHSSHRVTIFNLFRATPGYTEDILLDSQSPGMMEKRNLIERIGEAPSVPVVKQPKQQPVTVHQVAPLESKDKSKDKAEGEKKLITTTEVARAKKKTGRRRVVELSRDDSNMSNDSDTHSVRTIIRSNTMSTQRTVPVSTPKPSSDRVEESRVPDETSSGAESTPPRYNPTLPEEDVDWSTRGDEYRRKVEALKNEVGSGWLSVLSEEGLSLDSARHAAPNTHSPSPITVRR